MSFESWKERVQSLPCVICFFKLGTKTYGCEAHHPDESSKGRNEWAMVPLCREHHQGGTGVHGLRRRGFERFWKVNDHDLYGWTNQLNHKEP